MDILKQAILERGVVKKGDILKVDSFLNHQIDIRLLECIGEEFYRRFCDAGVTKILTIEASGIAIASIAAQRFDVPILFAKKTQSKNIDGTVYSSKVYSFTRGVTYDVIVSAQFLHPEDNVLIIDDFLAKGSALNGLIDIVQQSGASLCGAGIVIEKAFDVGGELIRKKGVRVESLVRIRNMSASGIEFF